MNKSSKKRAESDSESDDDSSYENSEDDDDEEEDDEEESEEDSPEKEIKMRNLNKKKKKKKKVNSKQLNSSSVSSSSLPQQIEGQPGQRKSIIKRPNSQQSPMTPLSKKRLQFENHNSNNNQLQINLEQAVLKQNNKNQSFEHLKDEKQQKKNEAEEIKQALKKQNDMLKRRGTIHINVLKQLQEKMASDAGTRHNIVEIKTTSKIAKIQARGREHKDLSSIIQLFQRILFWMRYEYPLSNFVLSIGNSFGKKSQLHFTYLAFFINNSAFSLILFSVFIFVHTASNKRKLSEDGLSFYMYHQYIQETNEIYALAVIIFVLVQIIIAFFRYSLFKTREVMFDARQEHDITAFRMCFGEWNWRLKCLRDVQRMKFSLVHRIKYYLKEDYHQGSRFKKGINFDKVFVGFIMIILNLGLITGGWFIITKLHNSRILFEIAPEFTFFGEILQGFVVSAISFFVSFCLSQISSCEPWTRSKNIIGSSYTKQIFAQFALISFYIFLQVIILVIKDDSTLGDLFNTQTFDPNKYDCKEQQITYMLLGLQCGYFLMSFLHIYLPSIISFIVDLVSNSYKQLDYLTEFEVFRTTYPLLIQNMIVFCLMPLTPIGFVLQIIMNLLFFINNSFMLRNLKIPQFSGLSNIQIRNFLIYFYFITLLITFGFYGIISTMNYDKTFFVSDSEKQCGPFPQGQTAISMLEQYIHNYSFLGFFYDLITWRPLLWACVLIFFIAYRVSSNQSKEWRAEYKHKIKELSAIKSHYDIQIRSLEDKIKFTKDKVLQVDKEMDSIIEDDNELAKSPDKSGTPSSNQIINTQQTNNFTQATNNLNNSNTQNSNISLFRRRSTKLDFKQ